MTMVSAVIGFKDWGLERLALSVESINASLGELRHEVVVCDYGSQDEDQVRATIEAAGAICTRVETDGGWSRSRALNGAVAASRGDLILATDADMLFSPQALRRVVDEVNAHPHQICILQCRDLPVGHDHEMIRREGMDWTRFAQIAQLRPRWGMGGLVAVRRSIWDRLRGWDERMHTYGGEDIDFARRAQRFGSRINWLDEPGVAMYHIWHPSTAMAAQRSTQAKAAIAHNRALHSSDLTCVRNRTWARYLPHARVPVVSVVIPTNGHDDDVLGTLICVLNQTVRDIEVLLLGGTEEAAGLDPRIRVRPITGPHGLALQGTYLALAYPGVTWEPNRLEKLLDAACANTGLVSDVSSSTVMDAAGGYFEPVAEFSPFIADGCLIRSCLLAGIEPGTTWNDLVVAVAESGAPWTAIGDVLRHTLVGPEQEESVQMAALRRDNDGRTRAELSGISIPEVTPKKISLSPAVEAIRNRDGYLVSLDLSGRNLTRHVSQIPKKLHGWNVSTTTVTDLDKVPLRLVVRAFGNGLSELTELFSLAAKANARLTLGAHNQGGSRQEDRWLVETYEPIYGQDPPTWWILAEPESESHVRELVRQFHTMSQVTTGFGRVIRANGEPIRYVALARTTADSIEAAVGILGGFSQRKIPIRLFLPESTEAGAR